MVRLDAHTLDLRGVADLEAHAEVFDGGEDRASAVVTLGPGAIFRTRYSSNER